MFHYRDSRTDDVGDLRVDVAFTDSSIDLRGARPYFTQELSRVETSCGVRFARLHQEHGAEVLVVDRPGPATTDEVPTADGLVSATRGLGLMIRVADCIPVLLADQRMGLIGAIHAGRAGVALDIVTRGVERLRLLGARGLTAWIGPHVCGGCYEVPEQLRVDVSARVPATHARTTWGTPALDLGAGVREQLETAGVEVVSVGGCTMEDPGLHSFRRDGAASGRSAGLVWMS